MPDYGDIRRTLRLLNERYDPFDGEPCLTPGCPGTVYREANRVTCDECNLGPAA